MLVFLRHFKQYIECGPYDRIFWTVDGFLGQLIVTTFLFYSGYGILVSLKNKPNYLKSFAVRIFRIWLQFALAVCLYILLNLVMGEYRSLSNILLAFTAWNSVGNSNWYILAILSLYFFTFFGRLLSRGNSFITISAVCAGCVCYGLVMVLCRKGDWYYDTIFCYPAGMLLAEYEPYIEKFLSKARNYWYSLCIIFCAFCVAHMCMVKIPGIYGMPAREARSVLFAILIVLITVKVQIGNPVLDWLGNYTFEVYILQRIPMIAFAEMKIDTYLYFYICLVITILISVAYKNLVKKIFKSNTTKRNEILCPCSKTKHL